MFVICEIFVRIRIWMPGSVPLTFSFAQLAKGKSLARSKPATNSQAQALQHTVWKSLTELPSIE